MRGFNRRHVATMHRRYPDRAGCRPFDASHSGEGLRQWNLTSPWPRCKRCMGETWTTRPHSIAPQFVREALAACAHWIPPERGNEDEGGSGAQEGEERQG